jgi:hypothetical protein
MTRQEINKMMSPLPNQRNEESLSERLIFGTIFFLFLFAVCTLI